MITDNEYHDFQNGTAITIGKFDGMHRGHQLLMDDIRKVALSEKYDTICFKISLNTKSIYSIKEQQDIISDMGISMLYVQEFTQEFAAVSPEEFVKKTLVDRLNVKYISVGSDFRFGNGRSGNAETLKQLGDKYGFKVNAIDKLKIDDETVSSSRIKEYMADGNMEKVAQYLGRPLFISGVVEPGKKLGRTLGYPTVNLIPEADKELPRFGVYASKVYIGDSGVYNAITNIGIRPSVDDGNAPTVETFIYDFNNDIYGEKIKVTLDHFIRSERKFESFDALKNQIKKDIEGASSFYK